MRTGAIALQFSREHAGSGDHPLPALFRHGIPVVLSTDDPALFHTTLRDEYDAAKQMGLQDSELEQICEMRSEEHTSELQSRGHLVCRLLLEKKKQRQSSYEKPYNHS